MKHMWRRRECRIANGHNVSLCNRIESNRLTRYIEPHLDKISGLSGGCQSYFRSFISLRNIQFWSDYKRKKKKLVTVLQPFDRQPVQSNGNNP